MLNSSCHCGAIRIAIDQPPAYINECNCTLCDKSGARWGYFDPALVRITGVTTGYSRADKADPGSQIHFCPTCGSTTHFTLTDSAVAKFGNVVMGVNMRLMDEADLAGIELRYPDGRSWPGEGEFGYLREPRILGHPAGPG